MAELDLTNIADASIATPGSGVTALYADTGKRISSKDDAGLVRTFVDQESAEAITGVKTMTNMTALTNTATVPALTIPAGGTVLSAPTAGAIETDGQVFYATHNVTDGRQLTTLERLFRLTGTVGPISTIADVFGTNDGIGMLASGVYEIEWHVYATQNTGAATTWTWTITLSGAVTKASAHYLQSAIAGVGTVAASVMAGNVSFTTTQALPVTGSVAAANHYALIRCLVDVGATGRNVRLQLTSQANNATILANSYFRVRHLSSGNTGTFVA